MKRLHIHEKVVDQKTGFALYAKDKDNIVTTNANKNVL